ncbi:MAG: formylglycine-generating enzyme family protein [Gammaproteobacteria bacterium]|nr:formylglycine-generating enzyme family protein [Gammaproteobacteria bacterium]
MNQSIITLFALFSFFTAAVEPAARAQTAPERELAGEMVSIPAGTFRMGHLGDLGRVGVDYEKPARTVTVPAFKLGKHEVTFAQWDACVADGGCNGYTPGDMGWGRGNRPVIYVSRFDAQSFIEWLNSKTGGNYRLPTEAEWEYAARAGTTTVYSWDDGLRRYYYPSLYVLGIVGYSGNNRANCYHLCGDSYEYTAPAGSFPANPWGLHDMHGNVEEWVQDCWNDSYEGAPTDGSAWMSGDCSWRVARGGFWGLHAAHLRSAQRSYYGRSGRYNFVGFRLAQDEPLSTVEANASMHKPHSKSRLEMEKKEARSEEIRARISEPVRADEMVSIPAGSFRMGDVHWEGRVGDEHPVHTVKVPAFKLSKHEVTFAQWDACVADGGCNGYTPGDYDWGRGNRPVIYVSWDDIQSFIRWLNARTDGNYRLPTEAEWEYAARAGTTKEYSWGDDIRSNRANCENDYCGDSYKYTAPAGSFPANPWGLHDMHGNVEEWVQDCWNDSYEGAPTDGSAWMSGDCSWRVARGGFWGLHAAHLRSAQRSYYGRSGRYNFVGFRLAQDEPLSTVEANASMHKPHSKSRLEMEKKEARSEEIRARISEPVRADEMVSIPGGTFHMGDLSGIGTGDDDELPVRTVTVPAFRLGKHEVTFAQWDACVADGGCNGYIPGDMGWGRGNQPVINISWYDIQSFIDWLNGKTGGNYRLPTEAEWEYAGRASTTTEYSWGDDISSNRANCDGCGSQWDDEGTAPVGSFPANPWGVHDMHGNVWEWVQDCWNDNYKGAPKDGRAWTDGDCSLRVVRGGSWYFGAWYLRSANRFRLDRTARDSGFGFRLAQDE